ncbi:hypothetical protein [Catenuloplanes japonicus]|uniref:hypothetical protein n=1 Tax=Catenuloplanes japonicus TaxID=33876 RepID=UPI000527D974|nr:hypothetical protein [Catenuloplanes japonicus]
MVRRHTFGYEVLGFAPGVDPTPGDPDLIRSFADRHDQVRDNALTGFRVLGSGGELEAGRGEAMNALRKALKSLPDKLRKTADSFGVAADAYRGYADALADAQQRIDVAMDRAQAVEGLAGTTLPDLATDATAEQRADADARQDDIDAARSLLSQVRAEAADAQAARLRAADAAADALDRAAALAIPERGFFEKIGDFFQDFPFVQIIIDVLIAIITLVAPFVGLALAGLSLAIRTIGSIANGTFKAGTFLVDLLSLVPGGNVLRAGAKVTQAVKIPFTKVKAGTISDGIVKAREGITNVPRDHGILVGAREGGAAIGQSVIEQGLNGEPLDFSTIIVGAVGAGIVSGGNQIRKDRERLEIIKENEALNKPRDTPDLGTGAPTTDKPLPPVDKPLPATPDDKPLPSLPGDKPLPEKPLPPTPDDKPLPPKPLPFDAERDLDSIQEDANERVGESTGRAVEAAIDDASPTGTNPEGLSETVVTDDTNPDAVEADEDSAREIIRGTADDGQNLERVETVVPKASETAAESGLDKLVEIILKKRG